MSKGQIVPNQLKLDLYHESGFFFGTKYERCEFVGKPADADGHILVAGTPGSGKTMGVAIPTLMTWKGIQIIIDVKGDLHRHWLWLNRHTGKKVKVFSPAFPEGSCRYDPFLFLHHGGETNLAGNARDLALALMPLLPTIKDPVWVKAAQAYLTGVVIYCFNEGLSFIDTMLKIQLESIDELITEIMQTGNIIAKLQVGQLHKVQKKVIANIGMELNSLATLVTDPAIATAFSTEERCHKIDWLKLNDTTSEPFDIILEFPEAKLEQWKPMTMLMIGQLIRALEQRPERSYEKDKGTPPILVMLDEFPRLGKISAIKEGLATLRSRGVTFALFVQGLAQLDEEYGSTAARVIAELCAYKVVLNVADFASQSYFAELVGTTETISRSINLNIDPYDGSYTNLGRSFSEAREPIIYSHEFLTQNDVVLITPHGFCRVDKRLYVRNRDMFLMPQLLKSRDYHIQNPLTYSYA